MGVGTPMATTVVPSPHPPFPLSPSPPSPTSLPSLSLSLSLPPPPLHARALRLGLFAPALTSRLLDFYVSHHRLDSAVALLLSAPPHALTLFHFNSLIRALSSAALPSRALQLFIHLLDIGFSPNEFTLPHALRSASLLSLPALGRQLHSLLVKSNLLANIYCASALLDLCAKWDSLGDACKLFDRMPQRNVVAYNTMISAYAQNGFFEIAVEMLDMMEESGMEVEASSWNSVIAGCVRLGDAELALEMFGEMVGSGSVKPDSATFNTLLPVIPLLASLCRLRVLHGFGLRCLVVGAIDPVDEDRLWAAIAAGYAFHGCMGEALKLFERVNFKTTQLWVSMISGFLDCGKTCEAFDVCRRMAVELNHDAQTLSKVPLTLLLPECSPKSKAGLEIHGYAYRKGLEPNISVCNALIAMYAKRGDLESSLRVFQRTPEKDVISWNTMFSSYALTNGNGFDFAFELFRQMLAKGFKPDEYSFSSVLNGCGHSSYLRQGMALHGYMVKSGFSQSFMVVQNALMDAYGKCGCVEEAKKVFDEMNPRDSVSWNTIISCYGFSDRPLEAFSLFEGMKQHGWKPNRITFITLLSACSHAGLLDEGLYYFEMMSRVHGVVPDLDHYACIVDNLGRAGQLDRAYKFIKDMPLEPDDCIWSALLSGCRIHGNVELAEVAAKKLIELEPQHSGYWVLLSNIYANASRWGDVAEVRAAMKNGGVRKCPGYSWIEIGGSELHKFLTADKSHKQSADIYIALNGLTKQLKDEGYVPEVDIKKYFSW